MKRQLIHGLVAVADHLPERFRRPKRFYRRLRLADLARRDMVHARVEVAREMGAKVGDGCRFFSLNIFSEPSLVEIGNNVIISGEVMLLTHDGAVFGLLPEMPELNGHYGRISIGDNCFIGMGAIILPNVRIGNNCIVAAGAVVFESFPDDTVIMGNPAHAAFSTSVYLAMKRKHPHTIIDGAYPFPLIYPAELLEGRIAPPPPARKHPRVGAEQSDMPATASSSALTRN